MASDNRTESLRGSESIATEERGRITVPTAFRLSFPKTFSLAMGMYGQWTVWDAQELEAWFARVQKALGREAERVMHLLEPLVVSDLSLDGNFRFTLPNTIQRAWKLPSWKNARVTMAGSMGKVNLWLEADFDALAFEGMVAKPHLKVMFDEINDALARLDAEERGL